MGKILKRSAAFLLSFAMLLTLSGFLFSAKAQEISDVGQQNQSYFRLQIENKMWKIKDQPCRFSVRYQQSDGSWVSIMDKECLESGLGKTITVPVGAKKIEYKVERYCDGMEGGYCWQKIHQDRDSVAIKNCHCVLVELSSSSHWFWGETVNSRVIVS